MSIDMAQFHQVFFEESFEGLEAMESGLLNLDMGDVDDEEINTIFRAAHSIKGGSGTFGFTPVSDFTHVMETLLDEMRDGRRQVTQRAVDVLLGSVDCLKEMITAIQDEQDVDTARVSEYQKALDVELRDGNADDGSEQTVTEALVPEPTPDVIDNTGWKIAFSPHSHLLKTGNDPVRMFRELSSLGDLTTTGLDLDVKYKLDTAFGDVKLSYVLNYVLEYEDKRPDGNGGQRINTQEGGWEQLQFRWTAAADWSNDDFGVHLGINFVDEFEQDPSVKEKGISWSFICWERI